MLASNRRSSHHPRGSRAAFRASVALLGLIACAPSCTNFRASVKELPLAETLRVDRKGDARCFRLGVLSHYPIDAPSLIPISAATGRGAFGDENIRKAVAWRYDKLGQPDVVLYEDAGSVYAGSVATYVGFGVTTSTPHFERAISFVGFRYSPVRTGIVFDQGSMVMALSEAARQSGLIEGDTVLSIDGRPVTRGDQWLTSPHFAALCTKAPGDTVEVVWIRPGAGRMQGTLKLEANPTADWDALPLIRAEANMSKLR